MTLGKPKELSDIRRFFLQPALPKQRQYEALRAYFVEGRPSQEAARAFGYSPGAFRVLCHDFLRDPAQPSLSPPAPDPAPSPRSPPPAPWSSRCANRTTPFMRSVRPSRSASCPLSPTAVREVLKAEGFAALPRRLDEERPAAPAAHRRTGGRCARFLPGSAPVLHPLRRPVSVPPRTGSPGPEHLALAARLPGSKMIPPAHALRACLALKLWSIERKSHVMALVADEGLALFSGLNASPKKSYLSEYSSRITPAQTDALAGRLARASSRDCNLLGGSSFNLDFHSVPYYGEHPVVEKHYVSMRSRRQPGMLVFLAQDEQQPDLLLFQRRFAQRRGSRGNLPLHRLLGKGPRAAAHAIWSLIPS